LANASAMRGAMSAGKGNGKIIKLTAILDDLLFGHPINHDGKE